MGEHPASDIDVSSGKRHGIDDRTVENRERDRSIAKLFCRFRAAEVTGCENAVADLRDVALELRIPVKTEKRGDFFAALLADLGFLLPGIAEKTLLSGCRNDIRGAADVKKRGQSKRQKPEHCFTIQRKPAADEHHLDYGEFLFAERLCQLNRTCAI